jgi:ornithine cyclodeaminase
VIQLDDDAVASNLPWPALVEAIECALRGRVRAAVRGSHMLNAADGEEGRFLVMPAWEDDEAIGIKLVTYWRDNVRRGTPTHGASYILLDARSGHVRAVMAAEALTHRRTAALSVIAARRLLRPNARRLLVIGTGPVAEHLVIAHHANGCFDKIEVFGRSAERSRALTQRLGKANIQCSVAPNLESAVRGAQMIASATSANLPFLKGEWLAPGTHVGLFGSFTPTMRESDDALMGNAAEIWVDALSAIDDAGDLVAPIANDTITRASICGDLQSLLERGPSTGEGITVFKSVGTGVADFAAAQLALTRSISRAPTSQALERF